MSTIKDVARLARVSHGTVSNVLRKQRGVSLDKIQRVESAIRELGYRPIAAARSLKTSRSTNVAVVLPNIADSAFAQLYQAVERTLSDRGFTATLYVTSEIVELERRILESIRGDYVAGLIIATCQPQNTEQFQELLADRINMVFVEREVRDGEFNFLGFNNRGHIYEAVARLIAAGYRRIALMAGPPEYNTERQAIEGYRAALAYHLPDNPYQTVAITNLDKESAFNMAFGILRAEPPPDAIVTSSALVAEGLLKALSFTHPHNAPPKVVSLWSDSWADVSNSRIAKIRRPYVHLGEQVAKTLLDNVDNPFPESRQIILDDCSWESVLETPAVQPPAVAGTRPPVVLRVLLLESPSSYATLCLLDDFRRSSGIDVQVTTVKYAALYDMVANQDAGCSFDICQVDIPWLPEFAQSGLLRPLDDLLAADGNETLLDEFIPGIPDHFARYGGHVFGLPYMYCSQLLFYRKDLFTSLKYQTMFQAQHRAELSVPRSWNEFNVVARFFTKEFNSDSETLYGTTLGGMSSSGALCEFLPRLFAFGGAEFDADGRLVLDKKVALKALRNYCESYRYASPASPSYWWEEQVDEFREGKAAMMMLFSSHAAGITDRNKSRIVGNIGYDVIPGNKPLLGGYSLGVYANSRHEKEAFAFIRWACTKLTPVSTVLGGSIPTREMRSNTEVLSIFPWYLKAFDVFANTVPRRMPVPRPGSGRIVSEHRLEQILGGAVHDAVTRAVTPEVAIGKASEQLDKLMQV
jgi:DNA-binding LacI/PurR family transcriptional regulator/ABC-type glycerol-3-phosphate transport system substrate-binding protein